MLIPLQAELFPDDARVTVAVPVTEPLAFVAVSVYVVVEAGITVVEPFADVDVNAPGVMLMLVAALVFQLSMLLPPALIVEGFATKDVIAGPPGTVTVTVAVLVAAPAELVAVSVYVVVEVGVTEVEPLADDDVNAPGPILMLVELLVLQLSVVAAPALMIAGLPPNEPIVGSVPFCVELFWPVEFCAGAFVVPHPQKLIPAASSTRQSKTLER